MMGVDYSLDTTKILKSYGDEVGTLIGNFIEELPMEADILIAGGGGAHYLKNMPIVHKATIVNQAQHANACGYYDYGCHVIRSMV